MDPVSPGALPRASEAQHLAGVPFPPAPWRLQGQASIQLQLLPVARVRSLVPTTLGIVSLLPGKTLGALYLAAYGAGSTLQYHELIVVAALVRQGARLGAWISHIYVDDEASLRGGQEIWALPKQLAVFDYGGRDAATTVRQGCHLLCTVKTGKSQRLARLPLLAPVFSRRGQRLLWFRSSGSAQCSVGAGRVDVPADSPLALFGFGRGRRIWLENLDISIGAPSPSDR